MSLEFRHRRQSEGINDYNENLKREIKDHTWDSMSNNQPYDPEEAQRIAESKRKTMEGLERITITSSEDEKNARQKVLDSYSGKAPKESHEQQSDYGKTGAGSFFNAMTQRDREYYKQQEQQNEEEDYATGIISSMDPSLTEAFYSTGCDSIIKSEAFKRLPEPVQEIFKKQMKEYFDNLSSVSQSETISYDDIVDSRVGANNLVKYIDNATNSISQYEELQKIPEPKHVSRQELDSLNLDNIYDGRHYLILYPTVSMRKGSSLSYDVKDYNSVDDNNSNMWSYLARSSTENLEADKRSVFAYTIDHLNFSNCLKDGQFDFNSDNFFDKNNSGFSAIDILIQNGDTEGLKALMQLGHKMAAKQLPEDSVEDSTNIIKADTTREGVKLLTNLQHSIINSIALIPDDRFQDTLSMLDNNLGVNILELAYADNKSLDPNRKKMIRELMLRKINQIDNPVDQAQFDVAQYYNPSLSSLKAKHNTTTNYSE